MFDSRHFVRHLGICNRICVNLLQLMCAVIMHNSVKKTCGWVIANYSVSQPPFCPPSWNLLSDVSQTSTTHVRCQYAQFSEQNEVSILINGWVIANYRFSQPPFFRHRGICYRIWVKLLQLMCAVITHNLVKKRSLYINKWLSYSQLWFFTAAILSAILEFVIGFVSNFYNGSPVSLRTIQCKNRNLYINKWLSYSQL